MILQFYFLKPIHCVKNGEFDNPKIVKIHIGSWAGLKIKYIYNPILMC